MNRSFFKQYLAALALLLSISGLLAVLVWAAIYHWLMLSIVVAYLAAAYGLVLWVARKREG